MKIAVLSDIHGNLPALESVVAHVETWQPDLVVVDGDIVNRGPLSLDCLRLVQEKQRCDGWNIVRGNHEDYIVACSTPESPQDGREFELWRFAHWSYQQLNGNVAALAAMPEQFSWIAPDGSEFRVRHGSMQGNRDGIYVKSSDEQLFRQINPPPAVFVTAHTHMPLLRHWQNTLIVNVGSVGAPFDCDNRASYGQFTWSKKGGWQAEIVRVPFDYTRTERDFAESGFLEEAGPLAQLMLLELRRAGGLIYRWAYRYQDAFLAGEIEMEVSVREMMHDEDIRPYVGSPGWSI
ncbi:MAG: metallophosphoesterase family protein [Anaerolineae bacterium]